MRILSLSWGTQTWTMACMVATGELPPVDFALFADTGFEKETTYNFARQWSPWLEEHGIEVVALGPAKMNPDTIEIPAYAITDTTVGKGQITQQCTGAWKILPMQAYIRERLRQAGIDHPKAGEVEKWLGITVDEWYRVKDSMAGWICNVYPLIDLRLTRDDCLAWLDIHGLPVPPRSSCIFCPFHSSADWHEIRRRGGHDWQTAVNYDARIRDMSPPYPLYIHPSRRPLPDAANIPEDDADDDMRCDGGGYCFT